MGTTYFGLICPQCHAAYPLGTENKRDWRYDIGDLRFLLHGGWELRCVRCEAVSQFADFTLWQPADSYSAAQMAIAGLRVRRVRGRKPQP